MILDRSRISSKLCSRHWNEQCVNQLYSDATEIYFKWK